MKLTKIWLLQLNDTQLIKIAFPFNGGGVRVVPVDYCQLCQVHSLTAMRAPRETLHRSMKDTCPTSH